MSARASCRVCVSHSLPLGTCRTLAVDGHASRRRPSAAEGRGPAGPGSHVTSAASTPLETPSGSTPSGSTPSGSSVVGAGAPVPPSVDAARLERVLFEIKRVIVGQDRLVERMLVALLARGHVLLEGVPGVAKTLAVETLATVVGGK